MESDIFDQKSKFDPKSKFDQNVRNSNLLRNWQIFGPDPTQFLANSSKLRKTKISNKGILTIWGFFRSHKLQYSFWYEQEVQKIMIVSKIWNKTLKKTWLQETGIAYVLQINNLWYVIWIVHLECGLRLLGMKVDCDSKIQVNGLWL